MTTSYREVLAQNIKAERGRAGLSQQDLAGRMRALGFSAWLHQTVGSTERGKRRLLVEELFGLALAIGTSMGTLLAPAPEIRSVELPGGQLVDSDTVRRSIWHRNDGLVWWEGEEPRFDSGEPAEMLATSESIALQQGPFIGFTPRRRSGGRGAGSQ